MVRLDEPTTIEECKKRFDIKKGDSVWVEWCKQVARCRLLTLKQPIAKVWADYQQAIK